MVYGKEALSSDAAKALEKGKDDLGNISNKFSVLIVDDDPLIRRIHKMLLNKFKVESQAVENGKEAVDLYFSGASFDLVLMDMEMPIMDGPTATKMLRAMGVNSMIVGITSRDLKSEQEVFKEAGADGCYVKPLSVDKLGSILEELYNKCYCAATNESLN